MTKIKVDKIPSVRKWMEDIEHTSPYFSIAIQMLKRRNNYNPTRPEFITDLFEAFHEIAKVAHKLNKEKK